MSQTETPLPLKTLFIPKLGRTIVVQHPSSRFISFYLAGGGSFLRREGNCGLARCSLLPYQAVACLPLNPLRLYH